MRVEVTVWQNPSALQYRRKTFPPSPSTTTTQKAQVERCRAGQRTPACTQQQGAVNRDSEHRGLQGGGMGLPSDQLMPATHFTKKGERRACDMPTQKRAEAP
jgi:hypothetical protein